jgi:hypothetical protein
MVSSIEQFPEWSKMSVFFKIDGPHFSLHSISRLNTKELHGLLAQTVPAVSRPLPRAGLVDPVHNRKNDYGQENSQLTKALQTVPLAIVECALGPLLEKH